MPTPRMPPPRPPAEATAETMPLGWRDVPAMQNPSAYLVVVLFSSLDVVFTRAVFALGGYEVNPLAREVIHTWGWMGATLFKFSLVLLAIVICEIVTRQQPRTGIRLAWIIVGISAVPVVWSTILITTALLAGG